MISMDRRLFIVCNCQRWNIKL